eukprot:gene19512-6719_t
MGVSQRIEYPSDTDTMYVVLKLSQRNRISIVSIEYPYVVLKRLTANRISIRYRYHITLLRHSLSFTSPYFPLSMLIGLATDLLQKTVTANNALFRTGILAGNATRMRVKGVTVKSCSHYAFLSEDAATPIVQKSTFCGKVRVKKDTFPGFYMCTLWGDLVEDDVTFAT